MLLLRKLYCDGCRSPSLHIIYVQKSGFCNYHLTAVCLSSACNSKRCFVISKDAMLELMARTKNDNPTSEGGI